MLHNKNMYQVLLVFTLLVFSIEGTLDKDAIIEDSKSENDGLGNYYFRFVTSNGITREETGRLVNSGQPDEHVAVEGFYTYFDVDGILNTINYKADTNGYVIVTPELIQPPAGAALPESVVASLLGK